MKPIFEHAWALTETQALELQKTLSAKVIKEDQLENAKLIAGVDVAYDKNSDKLIASVVVLDAETLKQVEIASVVDSASFPYIPGLFSFRELPPLIKAFAKLSCVPDLVVCDGQGLAHPRRFGLACHLGIIFDIPTIGCGKTRLIGEAETPETTRGASSPLIDKGEVIGKVLRTQNNINPLYVSIGHRISLTTACEWILKLTPKYRLPETTRLADQSVNALIKSQIGF